MREIALLLKELKVIFNSAIELPVHLSTDVQILEQLEIDFVKDMSGFRAVRPPGICTILMEILTEKITFPLKFSNEIIE